MQQLQLTLCHTHICPECHEVEICENTECSVFVQLFCSNCTSGFISNAQFAAVLENWDNLNSDLERFCSQLQQTEKELLDLADKYADEL